MCGIQSKSEEKKGICTKGDNTGRIRENMAGLCGAEGDKGTESTGGMESASGILCVCCRKGSFTAMDRI